MITKTKVLLFSVSIFLILCHKSLANEFKTANSVRSFLTIINFNGVESGKSFCHINSFYKMIGLVGASVETTSNILLKDELLGLKQKLDFFKSKRPKDWKKDKKQIFKAIHKILLSSEKKKIKMYRALSSLYLTNIALSLEIIENSNKVSPKIFPGCNNIGQNNHNVINEFKVNPALFESFYVVPSTLNKWIDNFFTHDSKIKIGKLNLKTKYSPTKNSFVNTDYSNLSLPSLEVAQRSPFEHLFGLELDQIRRVVKSNISPWNAHLSVFQVLLLSSAAYISSHALSEFSKKNVKLIDSYISKLQSEDPPNKKIEETFRFEKLGCIDSANNYDYYCNCKKSTPSTCFKNTRDELASDLYGELDIGTLLQLANRIFSGDFTEETFDKIYEVKNTNKITAKKVLTKIERQYVRIENLHPGASFTRPKMLYKDVAKKLIAKFATKKFISSVEAKKGLVLGKENLDTITSIESSME